MAFPAFAQASRITEVDPSLLIAKETVDEWFASKNAWGPTYTGSPAWFSYMEFIESHLRDYGAVKIEKNRFPFERWFTTEYPDRSGWSLVSDGRPVDVASYATQSGSTGADGVTAPLILYDMSLPEEERPATSELAGKIVVIRQAPYVGDGVTGAYSDYEYRTNGDTFGDIGVPVDPTVEAGYRNRDQFGQAEQNRKLLERSGAVGHVAILDMPPGAAIAGRQHSTPDRYDVPGLLVDRVNGVALMEDARAGKTATLVLKGQVEEDATAYQLAAVLPGRDYGTPQDRAVLMATHTDGPGLIQDSGALGILGVINYYAKLPQNERPMSIFTYFDVRHFIAGTEDGAPYDYVEDHMEELAPWIAGGVVMEHIGGAQMRDDGERYEPTGLPMTTYINTYGNDLLVELAIKAVNDSTLERAQVTVGSMSGGVVFGRPGVNGRQQNDWKGSTFAKILERMGGYPSWHITGDWPSSGYQAIPAIDRYRADVYLAQVATGIELVGEMMTQDLTALNPDWGKISIAIMRASDEAFANPAEATQQRDVLLAASKQVFGLVRAKKHDEAAARLGELDAAVEDQVRGKDLDLISGHIDSARARLGSY
ncbi:hypothetical protein [Marinivivus vitaminiproducens]|uniref:hypothetical protein n=1 Tax=Marinivivus vitaminiproducens TaxID=3035935 RepID=UPI00279D3531|nr:hypothetical protein P4R82_20390 [Geminicoccaceae bacterium SCSIO 64248]